MSQLKVMIVGTSPAETLRLEEVLQQTGCLDTFRYVGLDQFSEYFPGLGAWDLLIARYVEREGPALFAMLAPVLRKSNPAVFFLVDRFDPLLVTRLLNGGVQRVLPLQELEQILEPALSGVFGDKLTKVSLPAAAPHQEPNDYVQRDGGLPDIFRASPVGICIIRLNDNICVDCNASFGRLLEWPREELVGKVLPELALPVEIKTALEHAGATQADDHATVFTFESQVFNRDGHMRQVQVNGNRLDWEGEACFIAIFQDITEKEQAKEKVKRLNNELERLVMVRTGALEAANRELAAEIGRRKIVEDFSNQLSQIIWETPDIVAIFDADNYMQFLNKAGRKLFGLGEDASISHLDLFSFYPDKIRLGIQEDIQPKALQQGIWRGETTFQLANGQTIPISQVLLCQRDDDGQIQFIATMARDISDFKQAEQELRLGRERYRVLAEAAHDFIFMVSKDGFMEYANEYACQTLGYDPNKISGLPVSQFFPQDFAANHLRMFSDVHENDRPVYTEGPFTQNEKPSAWLGTWLVPIHREDGNLVSILGISRDITEQKKTDDALQNALQNERKLGEIRSNFFSMTSHQFRTPLSTILLSAELLQKYGQKWDEQKRAEHLIRIQEAAKRLNNMLEDILVIGRVESGRLVFSPKEFDLIEFCERYLQEISLNDHHEHPLLFEHEGDHLMIYQDIEVMHRVMDNLLSNAIKYSPKGSSINIHLKTEDQDIVLEVADQGIGIPEKDVKYLFQPFQRASNAWGYPGTGIGLTIIQKSMELMRGSITLKTKEGQGTTFMVRFPIQFNETPAGMTV